MQAEVRAVVFARIVEVSFVSAFEFVRYGGAIVGAV